MGNSIIKLLLALCVFASCEKDSLEISDDAISGNLAGSSRSTGLTLVPPVNHQFKWSDGTNVKIVGHNSPENVLHWLNYPFLDWLYAHGVNSIYASVNNKESGKPQISVWKNNQPSQGFDDTKVNAWVAYAGYWLDKDEKNVFQLVLFEKETLYLWTLQQQKDMITYLAQKFAPFNGRIIINTEEADNGWSRLNALYDHIKQVAPSWIRALHCNTNQNPWSGNYNTDRIHILSMQDNVSAFNSHINNEVPKNPHWVAIASEMTGGFQPNDVGKAETLWNAGGAYNIGVEVYIACCDHSNPANNWYQQYAPVFDRLKQLKEGSTTPPDTIVPPSTMEIVYSVNFSLNPSNVLDNGDVLPVGGMWFGVKQGTGAHTFILKRGTTTVNNVTDNTAPFQFKNNWLQMGSYTLTVNAEVRSFSVN